MLDIYIELAIHHLELYRIWNVFFGYTYIYIIYIYICLKVMGLNKLFLFFLATRFDIFFRTDYFDIIGKMDEVYQKLARLESWKGFKIAFMFNFVYTFALYLLERNSFRLFTDLWKNRITASLSTICVALQVLFFALSPHKNSEPMEFIDLYPMILQNSMVYIFFYSFASGSRCFYSIGSDSLYWF